MAYYPNAGGLIIDPYIPIIEMNDRVLSSKSRADDKSNLFSMYYLASNGKGTFVPYYQPLFSGEPCIFDIQQEMGNCYLLAVILGLVRQPLGRAWLHNMMCEKAGRVILRFFPIHSQFDASASPTHADALPTHAYIEVDKSRYIQKSGEFLDEKDTWLLMLEKAYAAYRLCFSDQKWMPSQAQQLDSVEEIVKGGYIADVIYILTGITSNRIPIDDGVRGKTFVAINGLFDALSDLIKKGHYMFTVSESGFHGIHAAHAFAVMDVYEKAGEKYILLIESNHGASLFHFAHPTRKPHRIHDPIRGKISVCWEIKFTDFVENFICIYHADLNSHFSKHLKKR